MIPASMMGLRVKMNAGGKGHSVGRSHSPARAGSPGVRLLAGLALVALLLAVVVIVPRLLYPPLTEQGLDRHGVTSGKDRIELQREQDKLQNDARGALLQGLGGAVLLLGAYFTWRQVQTSREQLQHNAEATREQLHATRQQLRIAEQGQLTERFTRAVDQLGSEHVDVRLGGIYALERIARDSESDRPMIGEVLTAYVRGHSPWPPTHQEQPAADIPIDDVPWLHERAPDVQAAMTVLGRGGFAAAVPTGLDLRRVDLRRLEAVGADLRGARLDRAQLQGANLHRADLNGAYLNRAQLQGATLTGAHLEGARLMEAQLQQARLDLAYLNRAALHGAQLQEANLLEASLQGAKADRTTIWPAFFDRRGAGVIYF